MRAPGHNALDRHLPLTPRDYFTNSAGFGTAHAGVPILPPAGTSVAMRVAVAQHRLVSAWIRADRVPAARTLAEPYGLTRSTWSRIVLGQRWAGSIGFAALFETMARSEVRH